MSQQLGREFGQLRSFLWPIHRCEVKKIVPMLLMLFLICFNYSILRNMKDSVVITTSGAEVIPFIKVWAVLPTAVLLTYIFAKLTNRFSQEQVFYIMISGFLSYYVLFAFVLYPLRDLVHPHIFADSLEEMLPVGFTWLIALFRYWSFTIFYALSELWSSIVLTVLFWGFANEITKIKEASRFYTVFSIVSALAPIIAGQAANFISLEDIQGKDAWEMNQMILTGVVVASGLLTMLIFRWMNKTILSTPKFEDLHKASTPLIRKKEKLSLRESFSYLSNSKYLLYIAVLVVSYNLVINLVEVVWKAKLKVLYPSTSEYNVYMNNLTSMVGVISALMAFCIPSILSVYGWTKTALITPFILLVTGVGFFSFLIFQDSLDAAVLMLTGLSPLVVVVFLGACQNCLSKAAKYSLFDATKEMAFIPLDHDVKLKGKAAIDGVGSRLGKSGGSLMHQGLLLLLGSLSASIPYVAVFLMIVIVFWMIATRRLGRLFEKETHLSGSQVGLKPQEA